MAGLGQDKWNLWLEVSQPRIIKSTHMEESSILLISECLSEASSFRRTSHVLLLQSAHVLTHLVNTESMNLSTHVPT